MAALLASCNSHAPQQAVTNTESAPPKGEFAFLLGYEGRLPADVGFLTNHVVERRLANMMKDSFMVFMGHAKYGRPVVVQDSAIIITTFYSDSDRVEPSAELVIDVPRDAMWAEYYAPDTIIKFTDHPSWPKPY
ncbi:MAG TPA: hypothetical protein VG603_13170 [Chitinophagales bacterium]|nr:hypothetical protein [Chitinophagales bacterium]